MVLSYLSILSYLTNDQILLSYLYLRSYPVNMSNGSIYTQLSSIGRIEPLLIFSQDSYVGMGVGQNHYSYLVMHTGQLGRGRIEPLLIFSYICILDSQVRTYIRRQDRTITHIQLCILDSQVRIYVGRIEPLLILILVMHTGQLGTYIRMFPKCEHMFLSQEEASLVNQILDTSYYAS